MHPDEQAILNAIPASGEIKYEALRTALVSSGKGPSLSQFHQMRRKGKITVRTALEGSEIVLYVSRVK